MQVVVNPTTIQSQPQRPLFEIILNQLLHYGLQVIQANVITVLQVKSTQISHIGILFKVWFETGVCSGFGFNRFHCNENFDWSMKM